MKSLISMTLVLILASQASAVGVDIKATKKKVDSHRGSRQQLAHGSTRYSEDQMVYEFALQARSAKVPSVVNVQWVILVEGAAGRIQPGTRGEKELALSLNKSVIVTSDPIVLRELERTGGGVGRGREDDIYGYGVRILTRDGEVIEEKYSSSKAETYISWDKNDKPEPLPGGVRRPIQMPRRKR